MSESEKKSREAKKIAAVRPIKREKTNAEKLGKPSTVKMRIEDWFDVPPCDIQRNTEAHWHSKAKHYLAKLCDQHTFVRMAVTESGEKRKLDCHTRTWAWQNGLTDAIPEFVTAEVVYVKDLEEVNAQYRQIDAQAQSKTASDDLFSALKEFNITPTSSFLFRCTGIVSALKEAIWEVAKLYEVDGLPPNHQKVSVSTCVQFFKPQLEALDSINPSKTRFSGPPTTAFLLAHFKYTELGKHVDLVTEFFRRHQNNEGIKTGRTHDAVFEVEKVMKKGEGGGATVRAERLCRILACVERFVDTGGKNATWQNGARVDMENYLLEEHAMLSKRASRRSKKLKDGDMTR